MAENEILNTLGKAISVFLVFKDKLAQWFVSQKFKCNYLPPLNSYDISFLIESYAIVADSEIHSNEIKAQKTDQQPSRTTWEKYRWIV